jgi:phenylacetate-CoA ligase
MVYYSNFHRKVIWPYIEKRRKRNSNTLLETFQKSEKKSLDELKAFQWARIMAIIHQAYEHTIYYRKKFDELDLKPNDIRYPKDFKLIPPVTRAEINDYLDDMIADNIPENERHFDATGGSTGLPTKFARDNACLSIKKASEYRFNMCAGWEPGVSYI